MMDKRFSDYGIQRDDGGFDLDGSRRSFPIRVLAIFIPVVSALYLLASRFFYSSPAGENGEQQERNTLKGMNLASVVNVGFQETREKKSPADKEAGQPDRELKQKITQAGSSAAEGRLREAVTLYRACLAHTNLSADIRRNVERRLSDVLLKDLFSSEPGTGKIVYVVQPGDTLDKIARRHGTTTSCILHINNLRDTRLRIGQKLTILDNPVFEWQQQTESASLVLCLNGEFLKRYQVLPDGKGDTRLWITLPEGRRLFAFRNVSDAAEIRLFVR